MSQHTRLASELAALSPAERQKKLLLVVAALHKDTHKVTKDTINAHLRALGKRPPTKKQESMATLLAVAKEAEAKPLDAKEHNNESESKGESKGGSKEESKGKSTGKGAGKQEAEASVAEEGEEAKSVVSEEEGHEAEAGEEAKDKVQQVCDRKGKRKIQSEDEDEEAEEEVKPKAPEPQKKQPRLTIDLLAEDIKLVVHTPPDVHHKGDMEDQHHHTAQLLAVPDAKLGMYNQPHISDHHILSTTTNAHQ